MLLIIDNYDSFTYNLYQYFCELNAEVVVYRNDQLTLAQIAHLNPSHLVISPGAGTPNDAGISLAAIRHFAGQLPILGVCLGHQAIGQTFGANVIRAHQVMHGKTSLIYHHHQGVFHRMINPLTVTRYHSLILEQATLPDCLEVTAWSERHGQLDEIMGIRHRTLDVEGVQFHPESILTEQGYQLLTHFLQRRKPDAHLIQPQRY